MHIYALLIKIVFFNKMFDIIIEIYEFVRFFIKSLGKYSPFIRSTSLVSSTLTYI